MRWWRCSQHEILREFGEGDGPVSGDDHGVFDAHSAHSRQVHPGFDGHHVAGSEGTTRGRGDSRVLMDLEPDSVPRAVYERVTEAGIVYPPFVKNLRQAVESEQGKDSN